MFKAPKSEFVYYRTYAHWIEDLKRRENWEETVDRVIDFLKKTRGDKLPPKVLKKLRKYMLSFDVFPSMRLVWAAGKAAEEHNVAIFNCAFGIIDCIDIFAEALYILMCGTGFGYRTEEDGVNKLAIVPIYNKSGMRIERRLVDDSKEGWADSVKQLITALYDGYMIEFDYSKIRPKGARLKTMGGRASGPEPLIKLHAFIKDVFSEAQGRKLTTLECSDIMNEIAESVVVGGVRRSSEIGLSALLDILMRHAKDWPFPARRNMSNNSAVYKVKPDAITFLKEWTALAASGTGERGIFNLQAAQKQAPKRRKAELIQGVNPCGEIMLRDQEFCNLTTFIVRPDDDLDSLLDKVETAAWIGTVQASYTDFKYLRPKWKENCDEEALLGVSPCGQADNRAVLTEDAFKVLKARVLRVNKKAAAILGINPAAAVTCGKPDGTVSQVADSGSGCHPWYAQYFIRRYRISATDPLYSMMKSQGVVFTPENGQSAENASTWVAAFPDKAPDGALLRNQTNALDQLEWYKRVQTNWCEHNQSITIYVKEDEWLEVGNWVYKNWDIVNGVSFLPYDGGHYEQAPYEEITKEQYETLLASFPKIDYTRLVDFEAEDSTEGAQTQACVGDKCEFK